MYCSGLGPKMLQKRSNPSLLTVIQEIEQGAPLEQMEYHWINPDADRTLQQGLDEDADDKQRSICSSGAPCSISFLSVRNS